MTWMFLISCVLIPLWINPLTYACSEMYVYIYIYGYIIGMVHVNLPLTKPCMRILCHLWPHRIRPLTPPPLPLQPLWTLFSLPVRVLFVKISFNYLILVQRSTNVMLTMSFHIFVYFNDSRTQILQPRALYYDHSFYQFLLCLWNNIVI